jgi:ribulose 1,5-bisphosphate synthetase/thiazole synthase
MKLFLNRYACIIDPSKQLELHSLYQHRLTQMALKEQVLDDNCVVIVGGGPIGMLSATVLAWYGVPSIVLERNATTTQ